MRNMREMLGESGRTMSNMDRDIALKMAINPEFRKNIMSGRRLSRKDREIMDMMMRRSDPVSSPQRMPLPDNEPRFGDRSSANQMFSIENEISNLMKSYNMLVEAQEFGRAQEVANMIDQLQQKKIGIQAQNAPRLQMRFGGPLPSTPSAKSTDTKITSFLRKFAITPHLMDVGFFQEPSFDKWVQATKSANKAGSPIPYVSPMLSDSIDALKVGYDAFIEDFNKSRQTTEPQQDEITRILDDIAI
jgi:hypothetical protein